ncbi:MAG: DNA polymerase III subunit alpha [bacterium]|nr:DNA polymerase III subunit alpha [bacterium]
MSSAEEQDFVHLHTHSHYSLLEALPQIPALVDTAAADGARSLALTDNGNLYGAISFYKECKEKGIKPIIGVDFYVAPRTRHDKEYRVDDSSTRLVLLAKNREGYRNLIQLVTKSYLEGFFVRPRIDRALIELHRDGLIAILPAIDGEHSRALRDKANGRAKESLAWFASVFGADCYAEITHHPEIEGHEALMKSVASLAHDAHIALVAGQEVYYMKKEDSVARELVDKIRTAGVLNRDAVENAPDFSFLPRATVIKNFADFPEALQNSVRIADACNLELKLGTWVFPKFPVPEGTSHDEMLRKLAYDGFKERNMPANEKNKERVEYELSVIGNKGYSPYFLVVADLLRHAREKGILTNTRGSAAGSLVSYLSGITTVNPIEYQLPFERFLNPERPSPPDIDMDLADNRRDELIDYVREKYGDEHVAQIGTFGTMMARAAVRDVSRALGHAYGIGDTIAKLIPFGKQGFPVTIDGALEETPELKEMYKRDPDAREVLDLARTIEGNARHMGVHAAGVVIAPKPVTEYMPVQRDPKGGKKITQYDMYAVEEAGLLKFDFLGLTNLSVLADSIVRVEKRLGIKVDLDRLPLDDKKTYEMLGRGETLGVFQLASAGMTSHLIDLEPSSIHDINAMVALYRPGPMAFIPNYIERKKHPEQVKYLDPRMEAILKNSYGVITYQDDVLEIATKIAGYTWLEADKFRKAMGKKIPVEMRAQKEKFTRGCIKHGMKEVLVQKLWEQIETFAAYGFNKAHAASYGNLAYKTAYMKANFPVDYMASVLTADAGDVDKVAQVVAECVRMGLKILPPAVNESQGNFTVVDPVRSSPPPRPFGRASAGATSNGAGDTSIRFGLYSIKNFGTGVADSIMKAVESGGAFSDVADFLRRVPDRNLNKKSLESLIKCGALDELAGGACPVAPPKEDGTGVSSGTASAPDSRGKLLANIDLLLSFHREHTGIPANQSSLFSAQGGSALGGGVLSPAVLTLRNAPSATMTERLTWEKELLGLYVSGHPLDAHKEKLKKQKMGIMEAKEKFPKGAETVIAGLLENLQYILTKNGEKMVFGRLSDYSGSVEIVVFPRTLKENETLIVAGTCVMLKGKFSLRNGESSFVVERVKSL